MNPTHRAAVGRPTHGEGMQSRGHRVRVLALALTLVLLAAAFVTLVTAAPVRAEGIVSSGSSTIDVTASTGYAFTPNSVEQVPTNTTITVVLTDATPLPHTFTIIGREGWVVPSTYSNTQIYNLAYGGEFPNLVNVNVSGSGDQETKQFTSKGPGWYEFLCTEGGHFASGMYGFIAFGMNLPSNLTVSSGVPGPGAALFIIIGSIVSLVVIALVLGFVVGRRKGSQHEMLPERLGYAEPPAAGEPLPPSAHDRGHP